MQTDNNTQYEINNEAERSIFILCNLMILLASLMGDSIILISTIKYSAITLNKVIITVIQHMAVCDLIQTLFKVSPITFAFMTDRWVMGELICHVQYNISWLCGPVTVFLTTAMTTLKLILVKYPLKTCAWSTRLGHRICCAAWVLALGWYTPMLAGIMFYTRDTIHFSYQSYSCNYDLRILPACFTQYFLISMALLSLLSYTIIAVTSLLLLVVARRVASHHRETLRWEGVMTVLLTVGVLFISLLPYGVVAVTTRFGVQYSGTARRAIGQLTNLNIVANFFVYSITVRSFRRFLREKISNVKLAFSMGRTIEKRQIHHQRPHQIPQPPKRQKPKQASSPAKESPEVYSDDTINSVIELEEL